MKVIWVLENIDRSKEFYSKFNILCLGTSAKLYKKHNPEDFTVLFCDRLTYEFLESLGIIPIWDNVEVFDFNLDVNKKVFWASSKLHILSQINEPVCIIDNDSLVHTNLWKHLDKDTVYVSNFENGKGYYPLSYDDYVRKLTYKARWTPESVNVSFLYLPDPIFTKKYADLSIQLMKEFTKMNVPNSQYLIFAEQLLLKHLLDKDNIKHKSLISTYWDCQKWNWGEDHDKGIWSNPESNRYYYHYGPLKSFIKAGNAPMTYEDEIKKFVNCIGLDLNLDIFSRK